MRHWMNTREMVRLGLGAAALMATTLLGARPAAAGGTGFSVEAGWYDMTGARNSAKAIFDGKSGGITGGASARMGIGEGGLYVGLGARYFQKNGERVFVDPETKEVFPLGHPLKVRIIPVYGFVGYRFSRDSSLRPYVAGGIGLTSYRESSEVGGVSESSSKTKPSGHAIGGLEIGRSSSLRFGVEAMYTLAPKTIGEGGVSAVYGEDDVGGLSLVGKVVFGW